LPVSPRGSLRRDEVARLSALGFRNKEIARIMGIKAGTVGVFKFQNRQRTQG
jgi:DNA-binding NarL/FixJ family response regulator